MALLHYNVNNDNLAWQWQISLFTFSLGKKQKKKPQKHTPQIPK